MIAFESLLLVEKAEIVQVHFTLEGEELGGQKKLSWVKRRT